MADQADERLKALRASMKVALGRLTGSDELEAQGAKERPGAGTAQRARAVPAKKAAVPAKKGKAPRAAKPRSPR